VETAATSWQSREQLLGGSGNGSSTVVHAVHVMPLTLNLHPACRSERSSGSGTFVQQQLQQQLRQQQQQKPKIAATVTSLVIPRRTDHDVQDDDDDDQRILSPLLDSMKSDALTPLTPQRQNQ
jgi:hypothetical protein